MKPFRFFVIIAMYFVACLAGCTPQTSFSALPSPAPSIAPSTPINEQSEIPLPSLKTIDEVDVSLPFEEWPVSLCLTEFHEEGMLIDHESTRHISGEGWVMYIMPDYEAEVTPDGTYITNTRPIFRGCGLWVKTIDGTDAREALESTVKTYELEGYIFSPEVGTGGNDDIIRPIQTYNDWEIERHGGQYVGSTMRQDGYFAHGSLSGERSLIYLTLFTVADGGRVALIAQTQEVTNENALYSSVMPEINAMRHTFHLK